MSSYINYPAVIFAGGKSSRMGKDKALLPFSEYSTLVEFQYQRLEKIFNQVYISWKSEKVQFGANSIFDLKQYNHISAPTVGLLSSFEKIDSEYIFVISVDTPFFGQDEIQKLFDNLDSQYEIITAKNRDGVEPLISIYSRKLYPKIKEMVENNNHKLKQLFTSSQVREVYFDEVEPFLNLNYWHEYQKAFIDSK